MIPKEMIEAAAAEIFDRIRCVSPGYTIWSMTDETVRTRYRMIAAAALTAALSSQWRGIESAPKDGTWILVWYPGSNVRDAAWCYMPTLESVGHWTEGTGKRLMPTHWMPLPPPPATEEGEK